MPDEQKMSLEWKDVTKDEPQIGSSYDEYWESDILLVWVDLCGPALGRFLHNTKTNSKKFIANGHHGDYTVTHWSYIPKP